MSNNKAREVARAEDVCEIARTRGNRGDNPSHVHGNQAVNIPEGVEIDFSEFSEDQSRSAIRCARRVVFGRIKKIVRLFTGEQFSKLPALQLRQLKRVKPDIPEPLVPWIKSYIYNLENFVVPRFSVALAKGGS